MWKQILTFNWNKKSFICLACRFRTRTPAIGHPSFHCFTLCPSLFSPSLYSPKEIFIFSGHFHFWSSERNGDKANINHHVENRGFAAKFSDRSTKSWGEIHDGNGLELESSLADKRVCLNFALIILSIWRYVSKGYVVCKRMVTCCTRKNRLMPCRAGDVYDDHYLPTDMISYLVEYQGQHIC